jgi:CRP-like cAMP-binding protein
MPDSPAARRSTPLDVEAAEPEHCTLDRRLTLLGQVPFFAGLAHADVARINLSFHDRGFEAGDPIYAAGDEANRLYVVLTGKVKVVRHTLAGQDVVMDLLGSGDFFGTLSALGDDAYPDTAYAQTGCCVISVEAADLHAIMQRYPPVALAVLEIVQERLRAAQDLVRQLSAEPVESRIAAALLRLADRMGVVEGERILIQTPLSRQDLADMVGTPIETASRVVSQFRKAGLIESGRQWIVILDRRKLAALAGET